MAIFKENIYEQILDDLRALNSLKNEAEFITFLEKIRDHASKIYTQIQKSVVEVDYSILRTQIAYVLRYFPGYWYQIYKALCVLDEDNLIAFRKNSINIGLFGCGPCPEIIGITRFFEKIRHRELALNIPQTINLNLFDKHSDDWLYARNLFISPESRIEKLNQFGLQVNHYKYDFSNEFSLTDFKQENNFYICNFQNCLNEFLLKTELQTLSLNFNRIIDSISDDGFLIISDRKKCEKELGTVDSILKSRMHLVSDYEHIYVSTNDSPFPPILSTLFTGEKERWLIPTKNNKFITRIYSKKKSNYLEKLNSVFKTEEMPF